MAGYLQEYLTTCGANIIFYRFQRTASLTQSTAISFSSSLIFQLLGQSIELFSNAGFLTYLRGLARQYPLGPQHCTFKAIWTAVESLLLSSESPCSIILDALDECVADRPSQPNIPSFLKRMFDTMHRTPHKILIFARPEPIFIDSVASNISIFMSDDLLLPDIVTFTRSEYERLGLPLSEVEIVLERVRSSSHGSFRWVEMFLDYLERSPQMQDFRRRLHILPPSISDLYK